MLRRPGRIVKRSPYTTQTEKLVSRHDASHQFLLALSQMQDLLHYPTFTSPHRCTSMPIPVNMAAFAAKALSATSEDGAYTTLMWLAW
jgi:hypothetical protein